MLTYYYSDHMRILQQGLARVWGEDLNAEGRGSSKGEGLRKDHERGTEGGQDTMRGAPRVDRTP